MPIRQPHRDPQPEDVTAGFRVDGPFDATTTQLAARVIEVLSRYLVYATITAAGTPDPATLDVVLRNLHEALVRMPTVLRGLHRRFTELSRTPGAYITPTARDEFSPATPHGARLDFATETNETANLLTDATVHLAELARLASKLGIATDE